VHDLASKIRSLTGRAYQEGSHTPSAVAVAIERGNTFSSAILVRQAFFVERVKQRFLTRHQPFLKNFTIADSITRRGSVVDISIRISLILIPMTCP